MISLPRIVGHRGAAALAPENTLAGFRRAAAEGVAWVEFDTRLAADGAVVIHDALLDRTSTGRGLVRAATLAALAGVDAGGWFGSGFAGEAVPALGQVLGLLGELGLGANIELKADPGLEDELAEVVAETVRTSWTGGEGRLLASSFSVPALAALARRAPDLPRGLLVSEVPPDWAATAQDLRCVSVHADHRRLTPEAAAAVKRRGLLLAVYTVNLVPEARRALSLGVDAVITDVPDLMLGAL
jgi:glycerophosphoryl diester phosphodiesterase